MAKCAECKFEGSLDSYLDHDCEKTGLKPTQIEHQDALTGGRASKVAAAALARGEARKEE